MKFLLISASLVTPLFMFYLQVIWFKFRIIFNAFALVSSLIFGNIAALSIYQIIKDNTVLMTNIHTVFLNPFFLISGSYLGIYFIYKLIEVTVNHGDDT